MKKTHKYVLALLSLFFCHTWLAAQIDRPYKTLAEIEAELAKPQKNDLASIALYNQYSAKANQKQKTKQLELATKSLVLLKGKNQPILEAEALYGLFRWLVFESQIDSAHKVLEKVIQINTAQGNTYGLGQNYLGYAFIHHRTGDYNASEAWAEKYEAYFTSHKYPIIRGKYYQAVADILRHKKDPSATNHLEMAIDEFEKANSPISLALCYSAFATYIQSDQKKFDEAVAYRLKAASYFKQAREWEQEANMYLQIGDRYTINSNYTKGLEYYRIGIQCFNEHHLPVPLGIHGMHAQLYAKIDDFDNALKSGYKGLREAKAANNLSQMNICESILGMVFRQKGDYDSSIVHFRQAIIYAKKTGSAKALFNDYVRLGDTYLAQEDYQSARKSYTQADSISNISNLSGSKEWSTVYLAKLDVAENKNLDAIKRLNLLCENCQKDQIQNTYLCTEAYRLMMSAYTNLTTAEETALGLQPGGSLQKAIFFGQLAEAQSVGRCEDLIEIYDVLVIVYAKVGDVSSMKRSESLRKKCLKEMYGNEAQRAYTRSTMQYEFDKQALELEHRQELTQEQLKKEKLQNERNRQALTISQQQLELSESDNQLQRVALEKEQALKKQRENELALKQSELENAHQRETIQHSELTRKNRERNFFMAGSALLLLLAGSVLVGLRKTSQQKAKSDALLLNILPEEVANELKENGRSQARLFNNVTVLFTDMVNFTGKAELLSPEALVTEIDRYFRQFDQIIEKYGLEKIKTIGDAYLAVGGLPTENENHAEMVARAALEIKEWMSNPANKAHFEIRLGLHSGPVVAGIVGLKKYAYDIWGDTVNTAARMEQNSEAGKINVSRTTFELLQGKFSLTHRGRIAAKNKGEIDMYYLES